MNSKLRGKQADRGRDQDNAVAALLVVVCAAQVIAALGAHQLAVMSGELVTAGGADLAMVIDIHIRLGLFLTGIWAFGSLHAGLSYGRLTM